MVTQNRIETALSAVVEKMMHLKNNEMKEEFPISLIDMDCWEWPQGVGLFGLYKYALAKNDQTVQNFLIEWFDKRIAEGIVEKNVNTTAPMLTLTYIYEVHPQESYLLLIEEWVAWIMEEKKLIRTGDNCFQHMITGDPNDGEILIDTIFMTILFLARAGKLLNKQEYIDEANYQILNHIKYLLNKEEGLFYHGFNFNYNHNYGKVLWGRGNSWYTVAIMELIEMVDIDPAIKSYFLTVYTNQVTALKKHVDNDCGLWHTVIDDPTSYIEISASAGFLCGIMHGIRNGVLKKSEYEELVKKGLSNILEYIAPDGTVENVSYGTPIGNSKEFYKDIPCCTMTYGQALMILLLQEVLLQI